MKVLLLEKERIVKKDIEMQLRKLGFEITSDVSQGVFDYIIVGQFSYLQELKQSRAALMPGTQLIFFTTGEKQAVGSDLTCSLPPVFISKPAQTDVLLSCFFRMPEFLH